MKYLIIIVICICSLMNVFGQETCRCEALLGDSNNTKIEVFDKPQGRIVNIMKVNDVEYGYIYMTILKDSANYFKVSIGYSLVSHSEMMGWIKKNYAVGTYVRNYAAHVNLYNSPSKKSKIKSVIPSRLDKFVFIKKCSRDWLYIQTKYKGISIEGWLEPEMQCPLFTTCN